MWCYMSCHVTCHVMSHVMSCQDTTSNDKERLSTILLLFVSVPTLWGHFDTSVHVMSCQDKTSHDKERLWTLLGLASSPYESSTVRVCSNGKEMLTKLTWSHSGIISCADLLKITMKYQTVIYPLSLMSVCQSVLRNKSSHTSHH